MANKKKPKSKILFDEHLGAETMLALAKKMGITYTQLYPYRKSGVNPTLLALEQLAEGLSKLHGKVISPIDLIDDTYFAKSKSKQK